MEEYDNSKDEILDSRILESENSQFRGYEVSLVRYNKGDIKVQISPFWTDQEGDRKYNKLSRIKYSWFVRIARAVKDMYDNLDPKNI